MGKDRSWGHNHLRTWQLLQAKRKLGKQVRNIWIGWMTGIKKKKRLYTLKITNSVEELSDECLLAECLITVMTVERNISDLIISLAVLLFYFFQTMSVSLFNMCVLLTGSFKPKTWTLTFACFTLLSLHIKKCTHAFTDLSHALNFAVLCERVCPCLSTFKPWQSQAYHCVHTY